jgi:hypothetical protein
VTAEIGFIQPESTGVVLMMPATHVSWVRRIDDRARAFCIMLAAIPREADRLALELAQTADFQPRSERLRSKVSKVISEEIAAQALSFEAVGIFARRDCYSTAHRRKGCLYAEGP